MVYEVHDRVQRGLNFAIVDEVDSILIDEARTPLIISGQADDHTELYLRINAVVPHLKKQIGEEDPKTGEGVIEPGDFTADEKTRQVVLTEAGHENAERLLSDAGLLAEGASLYDAANITLMHPCTQPCVHTTCSTRTSTTWSRTAKWSSSTNSLAAS